MFHTHQCNVCKCKYGKDLLKGQGSSKGNKRTTEHFLPRILSCGHSFCEKCIQNLLLSEESSDITCPFELCQKKTTLVDRDVKAMQVHKYLIGSLAIESTLRNQNTDRMLKLLEKKPSEVLLPAVAASTEKCHNCQLEAAEFLCERCDSALLCQSCSNEVHRSRILSTHKPQRLSTTDNDSSAGFNLQINDRCFEHPDKKREYFCLDCSSAMCADCGVLGSHSGHEVNRLDVVNQQTKPQLVETCQQAQLALGLINKSKKRLKLEKGGSNGEGGSAMSNPAMQRVQEVFCKLHALLQLKQHNLEEIVFLATGDNTHLLKVMEEEILQTGTKMEQLVTQLEKVLSNPVYEKFCDFNVINSTAQEILKLPCHLAVNELDKCSSVSVDVNDEILKSIDDLVTISSQAPTQNRFELVSIGEVSDEDLKKCDPIQNVQSSNSAPPSRQQSIGNSSENLTCRINSISINPQQEDYLGSGQVHSPKGSHGSLSRHSSQTSSLYEFPTVPQNYPKQVPDPYSQLAQRNYQPAKVNQKFYDDDTSSLPPYGESHYSYGSQMNSTSSNAYPTYGYEGYDLGAYNKDPMVFDYDHANSTQRQRPDLGGTFENFEQSARQYKSNQHLRHAQPHQFHGQQSSLQFPHQQQQQQRQRLYLQQQQSQQQFRNRDYRLSDPHYNNSPDFTVCREGNLPVSPPQRKNQAASNKSGRGAGRGKAVGRGRGAPAPAPVLTMPSSQRHEETQTKKKLFIKPPAPIKEKSVQVVVSHIESPGCFYVQLPRNAKALKMQQPKYSEYCNSIPPITDLHNVKYLFAKVNNQWRRGVVVKVNDRTADIHCIDIGITATVKPCDLRKSVGPLLSLPQVAVKCYLQGIQPVDGSNDWGKQCAEQMRDVLSHAKNTTLLQLQSPLIEDDHLPVDLLMNDQHGAPLLSMRDYLVFTERAVYDSPISPYIPDQKMLNQVYLTPSPLTQGDYVYMFVTHMVSPSEFYGQITNRDISQSGSGVPQATNAELHKLALIMTSMNEKYSAKCSDMIHKVFIPKPGDAVVASYGDNWYRAQIMALQAGHVKVRYVDYGNVEIIPASQIRTISRDLLELPAQAFKFSLHNVSPLNSKEWSKQVSDGMTTMCYEQHCRAKVMEMSQTPGGAVNITLTMDSTGENVGDVLVQNGLAHRSVDTVTVDEGVACKCEYAESPGEFYVLPLNRLPELERMTAQLKDLMEDSGGEGDTQGWQVNDNCVVKHGSDWVRAIIEELSLDSGRCKIRFIDSGHLLSKPITALRRPPTSKDVNTQALASLAYIAGIVPAGGSKSWGMTAKELIKELIEGSDNLQVIPKGQAKDSLPCDVLLAEELPSKIQGVPGEIIHVSVKEKLLDSGVALRGELSPDKVISKTAGNSAPSTSVQTKSSVMSNITRNLTDTAMNEAVNGSPPPLELINDTAPDLDQPSDNTGAVGAGDFYNGSSTASSGGARPKTGPRLTQGAVGKESPSGATRTVTSQFMKMSSGVSGACRMVKSPGGTIRSQQATASSSNQEQTDKTGALLEAAAKALSTSGAATPKCLDWSAEPDVDSSCSDLPTPELLAQLNEIGTGN